MHDTESLQRFVPVNALEITNVIARFNVEIGKFSLLVSKKKPKYSWLQDCLREGSQQATKVARRARQLLEKRAMTAK